MGPEDITELEDRVAERVFREVWRTLYQTLMIAGALTGALMAVVIAIIGLWGVVLMPIIVTAFCLYALKRAPLLGLDSEWYDG